MTYRCDVCMYTDHCLLFCCEASQRCKMFKQEVAKLAVGRVSYRKCTKCMYL